MKKEIYDNSFFLAKFAIIFALIAVGSFTLYYFSTGFTTYSGNLLRFGIKFSLLAFFSGLLSIIIIIVFHRRFKGLVCSVLALALSFPGVLLGVASIAMSKGRQEQRKTDTALYNMELLSKELKRYGQFHDGYLPKADNWCDVLMEQNPELTVENFRHPLSDWLELKGTCHIAFNRNLGGKLLADVPPDTILFFGGDGDWNLNGTSDLLDTVRGEDSFVHILTVDGSEGDYWYDSKAIRTFKDKTAKKVRYYIKPRW